MQLQNPQGHPPQSREVGTTTWMTIYAGKVRAGPLHERSPSQHHSRPRPATCQRRGLTIMPIPGRANGLPTLLGLPSGEGRSQNHTANVSSFNTGIVHMGHGINQPPTSIQSDDRPADALRLLSPAHPWAQAEAEVVPCSTRFAASSGGQHRSS